MPRYLVSLAGELVIPNLLLMRSLPDVDRHVFITPRRLARSGTAERLCRICGVGEPLLLEVEEFSLADCDRVLDEFLNTREAGSSYVVNLTSGSRIMALAAFENFRRHDAQILYLPPASNQLLQLWPEHRESHLEISYRLQMHEYLGAYGVELEQNRSPRHTPRQLDEMFLLMTRNSNPNFMGRVNRLGSESKSPSARQLQERTASLFSEKLGISAREVFQPQWLSFIKGAWFEEYFADQVDRVLGQGTASHGVKIEKDGVVNEIDTVFVHENILHICELKASSQLGDVNEQLYKLDSIGRDFGLVPRSFLVLADPDVEPGLARSPHLLRRAAKMGIRILTHSQLKPAHVSDTVRKMVVGTAAWKPPEQEG